MIWAVERERGEANGGVWREGGSNGGYVLWGVDEGDGNVLSPLVEELGQSYEGHQMALGNVWEHHYVG